MTFVRSHTSSGPRTNCLPPFSPVSIGVQPRDGAFPRHSAPRGFFPLTPSGAIRRDVLSSVVPGQGKKAGGGGGGGPTRFSHPWSTKLFPVVPAQRRFGVPRYLPSSPAQIAAFGLATKKKKKNKFSGSIENLSVSMWSVMKLRSRFFFSRSSMPEETGQRFCSAW